MPSVKIKPPKEESLHKSVAQFLSMACPRNGSVMWFHTANQAYLAGSKAQRCAQINKLKSLGFMPGVPDLQFIWLPDAGEQPRTGFIELKREGKKKLSASQEVFRLWAERLGVFYAICNSLDGIEWVLRQWQVPLKASMRRVA